MSRQLLSSPAFGKADLSNCEREQIHLAGSIQPFGALLLLREPDLVIVQASRNAAEFLGRSDQVLGLALDRLEGDLYEQILPQLDDPLDSIPVGIRCRVGSPAFAADGMVHRPEGGGVVVELERAGQDVDFSVALERALRAVLAASSLRHLSDDAARLFRDIAGYDRVMVYRFDDEGHGEVFAEARDPRLDSFLGNRYPASDIPQIARRLYMRNRVRMLADVGYRPVPLEPALSPISGRDLDMSLCFLRSMSPLHIQYLQNMGVDATLVVSLMVGGELWGLVACHHYGPRVVTFETRAACEVLAEAVATRISALDGFARAQAELGVRRLEQRMVEAITRDGDWRAALFDSSQSLLTPVGATGAALLLDGQILTTGEVPGTQQLRAVGNWLESQPRQVIAAAALSRDVPDLPPLGPEVCGLMAAPVSSTVGEYLVWFRPERVKTVTWAGDPAKPFVIGNSPTDLSPRRSFAQWHELVEGTCDPWTQTDLASARLIAETVSDVVLQFRTVRLLIVEDQLKQVGQQVESSEQPVIIADARGRVLMTNAAALALRPDLARPERLEDVARLFAGDRRVRDALQDLLRYRRPWRGEARLEAGPHAGKPLLVRADPVFSSPGRVLGFVLLFLDVSERKSAEAARRAFQESILAPHRFGRARLATMADPGYQALVSAIVDNAQVAALEITDGLDMARVPGVLEGLRQSVDRAAAVLERLIWHARRARD